MRISDWSSDVCSSDLKRRPLQVVLLGSAPLLIERGLTESLAGRFETLHLPHWSFAEMRAAFGYSLEDYLYFGGIGGPARWLARDRKSVLEGKSVSVRVDLGGPRNIKKKKNKKN